MVPEDRRNQSCPLFLPVGSPEKLILTIALLCEMLELDGIQICCEPPNQKILVSAKESQCRPCRPVKEEEIDSSIYA